MAGRPVHLHPEEDSGAGPSALGWRIGPGLVRFTGRVPASELPGPIRRLFDDDVLAAVSVSPGAIVTHLAPGRTAAADGATIRSALFEVLSAPGGWPDPASTAPFGGATAAAESVVGSAADREIAAAVEQVLAGEFGSYTESHGGLEELVDVRDGVVRVVLGGRCHGCAYADNTIRQNLTARLTPIPGFRGLDVVGDHDCLPVGDPRQEGSSSRIRQRLSVGLPRLRRSLNSDRKPT